MIPKIRRKKTIRAEKEVGSISNVGNNKTSKPEKGTQKSTGSTEEDDWELIEQEQALHDKKMQENDEESDDSEDDDEDDDEIKLELEGNVQHVTEKYTFEFNDMRDDYAEGICVLLRSLVQNPTKAYELAKVISSQTLVGTVVACEGGSDTFAFSTVLPLSKQQLLGSNDPICNILQDLSTAVKKTASSSSLTSEGAETFLEFVSGSRVCTTGVMLHKRFSNLPIQLVGPLHLNLEEDLGWAQHNHESDDSEQNNFRSLQYILLLCACSLENEAKFLHEGKALDVLGNSGVLYEYFEDEIFTQNAISAYLFKPKASATPYVAAIVPITSLKKCVNSICELIPPVDV
mmetsp:Transcript_14112/g.13643  ORF Transcript_14112/g.13643 Transcript_14112/m.13643 type:complete len:346 (+) Transcript_14112:89-1126(+)